MSAPCPLLPQVKALSAERSAADALVRLRAAEKAADREKARAAAATAAAASGGSGEGGGERSGVRGDLSARAAAVEAALESADFLQRRIAALEEELKGSRVRTPLPSFAPIYHPSPTTV